MIATLLLVLQLLNPDLTPGAVRPLTKEQVCATRWGLDARHVTTRMRRHVFAAYGIPWDARRAYVVDHLVPRQLGGADDILNLWPQLIADAKRKDAQSEVRLHKLVCVGKMTLRAAQAESKVWGRETK